MTKPNPYRRNKVGIWIDSKTGRFAKKEDYLPYLQKETAKKEKLSKASKEYWKDVKQIKNLFGITDTKEARKKLYNSPKYVAKRGKKAKQWSDFWKEANKQKMDKKQRQEYKNKLEEDDVELISF